MVELKIPEVAGILTGAQVAQTVDAIAAVDEDQPWPDRQIRPCHPGGAALGALTDKFPAWNQTFWDHLGVAIDLHKIHTVMVLDHRDCGAYKVILGEDLAKDPAKETAIHTTQLQRLGKMIKEKHPALEVELFLMALDGKVERIA